MSDATLLLLADIVLVAHFCIAAFITFGLPLIWIGRLTGWQFVHNPWFRYWHVGLMGFVLVATIAEKLCPLTIWEGELRRAGGEGWAGNGQSFVGYWVGKALFHDFSQTQYALAYGLFFGLVVLTFFVVPVRKGRKNLPDSTEIK